MKEALALIATYGLPIVLTVWFVFRIDVAITKLVGLLEAFIKWLTEKDTERKEKDRELRTMIEHLTEQCGEVMNRIKILEVKVDK
jgi:hypothetical protein